MFTPSFDADTFVDPPPPPPHARLTHHTELKTVELGVVYLVITRQDPAALGLFPGGLDEDVVRVIWKQMLKAVQAMHDQRVS